MAALAGDDAVAVRAHLRRDRRPLARRREPPRSQLRPLLLHQRDHRQVHRHAHSRRLPHGRVVFLPDAHSVAVRALVAASAPVHRRLAAKALRARTARDRCPASRSTIAQLDAWADPSPSGAPSYLLAVLWFVWPLIFFS